MHVQHDAAGRRFFVSTEGEDAELTYEETADGSLDLVHTFVPAASRDQGVADAMARAAFSHARENGRKVVATCTFVRGWLGRHPEERDLVA